MRAGARIRVSIPFLPRAVPTRPAYEKGGGLTSPTNTPVPAPCTRLLRYGMATMPDGSRSPTVVYSSFLVDGHPRQPDDEVVSRLAAAGIRAVVTGHQPHGDCPVVMRCVAHDGGGCEEEQGAQRREGAQQEGQAVEDRLPRAPPAESGKEVFFITADTSFSADVRWSDAEALDRFGVAPYPPTPTAAAAAPRLFGNPRGPPPPPRRDPRGDAVVEVVIRAQLRPGERYDGVGEAEAAETGDVAHEVAHEMADEVAHEVAREAQMDSEGWGADDKKYVRLHGVLSNGQRLDCAFDDARGVPEEATLAALEAVSCAVGSAVDEGRWWVKARMPSGGWLLSRGDGYDVTNVLVGGGDSSAKSNVPQREQA